MKNQDDFQPNVNNRFKNYKPIVTIVCGVISVFLFLGINSETEPNTWEAIKTWGAPSTLDIYQGAYWGLISSNFFTY